MCKTERKLKDKLNDLSLQLKIGIPLLIIFLLLVSNVAGVWLFLQEQEHDESVIDRAGRQRLLVQQMTLEAHLIGMGESGHRDELSSHMEQYDDSLKILIHGDESKGIAPAPPPARSQLLTVQDRWAEYKQRIRTIISEPRESEAFRSSLHYLQNNNDDFLAETDRAVQSYESVFQRKNRQLRGFLGTIVVLDMLTVMLLFGLIRSRVILPLNRLADRAETIAQGDLDQRIAVTDGSDEIGQLDQSLTAMRGQLVTSIRDLEEQNDRLEQFASIVSHDLRNPLRVANGHLDLIRKECDSEYLAPIEDAHERMNILIEELLTLARNGQSIESMNTVSLRDISEQAWSLIADSTTAEIVYDGDLGAIEADEHRLQQLLENLLGNAIEHGGRSVTITVGRIDDIGFFVADDGPGIAQSEMDRVFETGYSTQDGGSGLGLNIVQQIARAHGWTIDVSRSSSGGARFEITGVEIRPTSEQELPPK